MSKKFKGEKTNKNRANKQNTVFRTRTKNKKSTANAKR